MRRRSLVRTVCSCRRVRRPLHHFTAHIYSQLTTIHRPLHHFRDEHGEWWLLMEDNTSSKYDYFAPPAPPDPNRPSFRMLDGAAPKV